FLTGLQDVAFSPGVIRNEELAIDITRQFAMETMFFVDGRVSRGDEILVQGTLKVFEMETPPETSGVGAGAMNPAQLNRSGSPVKEALLDLLRMDSGSGFFRFEPGFPGFQGHFPGAPILPGVVMLLAGQVVAEKLTGKPLRIRTIDRAKFMQPVFPRQELRVDVTLADPEPFVADIRLTRDGQAVSTCRFTAEEA
ncbi:hypothetical protein HQ520_17995, partial [bacterium]|nr:hypothetical protein [bacterium]